MGLAFSRYSYRSQWMLNLRHAFCCDSARTQARLWSPLRPRAALKASGLQMTQLLKRPSPHRRRPCLATLT